MKKPGAAYGVSEREERNTRGGKYAKDVKEGDWVIDIHVYIHTDMGTN